jgi:alpha-1,3-rhamnosyl/mannosyltransferase
VITVHDLSVFKYPETHPAARVQDFEQRFLHSLRKASHVITDTETIREEVIEMFGVDPDLITAVPLGVDDRFRPRAAGEAEAFKAWGIQAGRYGLCISTLEPRKKIFELLCAWRELPQPVRARFPLVLAGGSGWNNEALHREIARASAEGWLRHLGFVEERKLPALYAGAALFLYPSISEGFGLPPLEAMASGVPVLVSGGSCLPEVGGDAPRYVDPDDIAGFISAIEDSLTDGNWRSKAVHRGLERAAEFTWARCIDATEAVYRKLIPDQ